jgi:hypothetical protein
VRIFLTLAGAGLIATSADAADMTVGIELPRMRVAEYHKPYVAAWISTPDRKVVTNLAVWYQLTNGPEGHGTKWLKDIRQWWRRTGRTLEMPVDGVSGPTMPPGAHTIELKDTDDRLKDLTPGDYILHVEASREVGGRELVSIPFNWAPENLASEGFTASADGSEELGQISLTIKP